MAQCLDGNDSIQVKVIYIKVVILVYQNFFFLIPKLYQKLK